MDVEKLYDVLEMNLQYQDFLAKLGAEVERKLAINKEKQVISTFNRQLIVLVLKSIKLAAPLSIMATCFSVLGITRQFNINSLD